MPAISDFKNKKSPAKKAKVARPVKKAKPAPIPMPVQKRRPGREPEAELQNQSIPRSPSMTENQQEAPKSQAAPESQESAQSAQPEKVEIHFPGSEILRAKFKKPFEVAESVATDWKHNGSFEDLKLGHPAAEKLATQGLRKAKEIEQKVIESGVIEKFAFQALSAGMKAQAEIQNIRDQVKAKFGKK